ncbi:MAG: hydrogenase maturation protease [Thermoplasmata archaeon]
MEELPEYLTKRIVVLGCGNVLFGDDGFGPNVAEHLSRNYSLPEYALILDVGTSVRELLFTMLLSERRPENLIIVDAVDRGRTPGEIFEIPIEDIPERKTDDFSMHQVPTSNMLKELRDLANISVIVIACQVLRVPEEVEPGLSDPVSEAVPKACRIIYEKYISRRDKG